MSRLRPVLHLVLALAVLVCGLHLGEPAHAAEDNPLHAIVHLETDADAAELGDEAPDQAGHHHCPMTVDPALLASHEVFPPATRHCARPATALRSFTRAPPLEPPAA